MTDPPTDVAVLVVDDQELIRDAIAALLDLQPGVRVVGTAANGREAIDRARELRPEVVLMDVRMPILDGVAAARELAGTCRVVMLSTFDDEEYVVQALRAGAAGYLLKDRPPAELAAAVRLAAAGVVQFDPAAAARLAAALTPPAAPPPPTVSPFPPAPPFPAARPALTPSAAGPPLAAVPSPAAFADLTPREVDVLRHVAAGLNNREIATALLLSEGTVKNHVSRILDRLGLRDRTQAAIFARQHLDHL